MHAACVLHLGKTQSVHETVECRFTSSVSFRNMVKGGYKIDRTDNIEVVGVCANLHNIYSQVGVEGINIFQGGKY